MNQRFLVMMAVCISLSACLSARNHPALDAAQGIPGVGGQQGTKSDENIVEVYFEFPGPQEKWAGPASFVLHVSAKDPHWALIHIAPAWFNEEDTFDVPVPGVSPAPNPAKVSIKGLSSDFARERMRYLAGAVLSGNDPAFKGCLSPVRVRLIRDDGTFIEKTGCRSESGWSKIASDMVEYFMTAKLRGVSDASSGI